MTNEEAIEQIEYAIITGSVDDVQCGALKMAINALESQRWIPVEERLPEYDKKYLCFCYKYRFKEKIGEYKILSFNPRFGWYLDFDIIEVTHWMPFPEPPKDEWEMEKKC